MLDYVGPHVPCIQRTFFVLSIIAIFIGLGAIAGGVLIILYMTSTAAIAIGAVVIFVGVILITMPSFMSFKVFDLRVKIYEGSPYIVKSYGGFPNDLSHPVNGTNRNLYSVPDVGMPITLPAYDGKTQSSSHTRTAYLPIGATNHGMRLDLEEESTSFATESGTKATAAQQQNPYYNVRARVADNKNDTSESSKQTSVTSQSNNEQKSQKSKLPVIKQKLVYHSTMPENDGTQPSNTSRPKPTRNVSSLYPDPDGNRYENSSTRI